MYTSINFLIKKDFGCWIIIKTNIKYFKSCTFKKEFYNYKILYNKIITDNEKIEIMNWRFAALLKIIQLTYKKIN